MRGIVFNSIKGVAAAKACIDRVDGYTISLPVADCVFRRDKECFSFYVEL